MDIPDNSYDVVWACESGEHMPDKKKYVEEMVRVLKPGKCKGGDGLIHVPVLACACVALRTKPVQCFHLVCTPDHISKEMGLLYSLATFI